MEVTKEINKAPSVVSSAVRHRLWDFAWRGPRAKCRQCSVYVLARIMLTKVIELRIVSFSPTTILFVKKKKRQVKAKQNLLMFSEDLHTDTYIKIVLSLKFFEIFLGFHNCSLRFAQVVEIMSLRDHLLGECDSRKLFKKCEICNEPIFNDNWIEHQRSPLCIRE